MAAASLRHLHGDLEARIPGDEIANVFLLQALSDNRHLLMLALTLAKSIQLFLEVERTFPRQIWHVRIDADAVEPMAYGTDLGRLLLAGVLSTCWGRCEKAANQKKAPSNAFDHDRRFRDPPETAGGFLRSVILRRKYGR